MGKCVFKEYQIKLHGNTYQIFIPDTVFDEFWVMPDGYFGVEYDWVAGNRTAMKWIRNAYIALTKYQNSIVYFPVRNITPVFMNC
ncbi:MAG: hypothetical protein IJ936_05840, partial [Peptococcaceae bacterium]|nr:hypothetical protein [Peptococcaceae bacterium]